MWGIVVKIWSRGAVLNIFKIVFVLTALVMKEVSAKMSKYVVWGYKRVIQENILRPKRCILLQNQKVCWLLTYHDSFISTLQIYAQKKEYKRYHSNFYHIDSTLTPHRLSTGLASQITILLALIPVSYTHLTLPTKA